MIEIFDLVAFKGIATTTLTVNGFVAAKCAAIRATYDDEQLTIHVVNHDTGEIVATYERGFKVRI